MHQKLALQCLVFMSGLMAGILLESRLFHSYRVPALAAASSAPEGQSHAGPQAPAPVQAPPRKASKAVIQVDEPNVDFGTAETGSTVERIFIVKNIGTEPLVIEQVHAGCGCTTTNLGQKEIEPGGATNLKVVFDLTGRVGKQSSPVTIASNDARQSNFRISLNGDVTSRVTLIPATVEFGRVKEGGAHDPLPVKIQVGSGSKMNILKAESTDPAVAARLEEVTPGSSYLLHVSVLSGASAGPLRSQVRLFTDSAAPYQQLTVPVHAYVGSGGPILTGDELEITGPKLGGGTADLKSMRGKVCVVVFWASWCGHCQAEMPELMELYKRHQADGLEILGINSDTSLEKAVAAVEKFKTPWPNISFAGQGDGSNPLFAKHSINGIPAIVLVGRDGRVASVGLRKTALKLRVEHLLKVEGVAAAD